MTRWNFFFVFLLLLIPKQVSFFFFFFLPSKLFSSPLFLFFLWPSDRPTDPPRRQLRQPGQCQPRPGGGGEDQERKKKRLLLSVCTYYVLLLQLLYFCRCCWIWSELVVLFLPRREINWFLAADANANVRWCSVKKRRRIHLDPASQLSSYQLDHALLLSASSEKHAQECGSTRWTRYKQEKQSSIRTLLNR